MDFLGTVSRRAFAAAIISFAFASAAEAQMSLDDQKKQLEIEQAELNKQKTMIEMIKGPAASTAGQAQLTAIEQSAEGLMLSRFVQEQTAQAIARKIYETYGNPSKEDAILVAFGDQPATTADYLAVKRGAEELKINLENANTMARAVFGEPEVPATPRHPRSGRPHDYALQNIAAVPAVGLALTAVTTIASLLKVNTTVAGAALPTPNEQYKAILLQQLKAYHWPVDRPRGIVASTEFADSLFTNMKPARDQAAKYYLEYFARLARKDGKPANLSEAEIAAGKALETALNDHAALMKALFTPVNGVLPASVIEEQKELAESAPRRRVLYIQHQKAALTSITKQGAFTGIVGVPAYVSASHVVEYAFRSPTGTDLYETSRYNTPVMKVTGVKGWLTPAPEAKPAAGVQPASGR